MHLPIEHPLRMVEAVLRELGEEIAIIGQFVDGGPKGRLFG